MRKRKAFTVVELIVTIAILAIAFALTTGLVSAMNNVQSANAAQVAKAKELSLFNDLVTDYVSFVSLNTDEISFTFDPENSNENKIVFNYSAYHFDLAFNNSTLTMNSNYDGTNAYFAKTFSQPFEYISSVSFEYTASIGQLVSSVSINGGVTNYSYIVRTAL